MKISWGIKLILIIISSILCVTFFVLKKDNKQYNTINSTAQTVLEKKDTEDINAINSSIAEVRKANKLSIELKEKTLVERFENAIILGDSIAKQLVVNKILPTNKVLFQQKASVSTIQEEILSIIEKQPEVVFLEIGFYDLTNYKGDNATFITEYKKRITQLTAGLPNAKICINNILPVQQVAINQQPYNANYNHFNREIKAMCSTLGLIYIDNDPIIRKMSYSFEINGIHPTNEYYMQWAKHMADTAGL